MTFVLSGPSTSAPEFQTPNKKQLAIKADGEEGGRSPKGNAISFATLGQCSRDFIKAMLEHVEPVVFTKQALQKLIPKGKRVENVAELLKIVAFDTGLEPGFELCDFKTDLDFFELARGEAFKRGHRGFSLVLHPTEMFTGKGQGIYDYQPDKFELLHCFTHVRYCVRGLFEKKVRPQDGEDQAQPQ